MDCRLKDPAGGDLFNQAVTALAPAVRATTTSSADLKNYGCRGATIILNVTAVPGTDTVTLKVQGRDPASGTYYDILTGAAASGTGQQVLKIYPGIAASANAAANDVLPLDWRVTVTHSAGSNFTYSAGVQLQA